jgi:hypothetical protein
MNLYQYLNELNLGRNWPEVAMNCQNISLISKPINMKKPSFQPDCPVRSAEAHSAAQAGT